MFKWMLVTFVLFGSGQGQHGQFSPFDDKETCDKAGQKWLDEHMGGYNTLKAEWDCVPLFIPKPHHR